MHLLSHFVEIQTHPRVALECLLLGFFSEADTTFACPTSNVAMVGEGLLVNIVSSFVLEYDLSILKLFMEILLNITY